jgi:rod shape-determining protein MreD
VRLAAVLWSLAAIGLLLQGAFATFLPASLCPDFALIMVLCIGMQGDGFASGSILAALLGFAADLLSGALLGQHALLFLLVFATGQIAARQLNLRSPLSLMTTGASVVLAGGLLLISLTGVSQGGADAQWFWRPDLLGRAAISALVTPAIFALVQHFAARSAEEEAGARAPRLVRPRRSS